MKKNYFIIQPFCENEVIFDEKGDVLITPIIGSINDKNNIETLDHIFYINTIDNLIDYENLSDFTELAFLMAMDFFDDYADIIDEVYVAFYDTETDEPKFDIDIHYDYDNDEMSYTIVEFSDDDEYECNGDCENCEFNNEEIFDKELDDTDCDCGCCPEVEYYFGFDF